MNYFELYEMPVSMRPDVQQVKQKFYELSRRYHPDFYTNASDQEQAEVLEKSSQVNKAFKSITAAGRNHQICTAIAQTTGRGRKV